jgi:hypothetical protein
MKQRPAIFWGVVCLALMAAMAVWQCTPPAPVDPVYHGKPASYWLSQVYSTPNQSEAIQAFRELGTNADPILATAFRSARSPWRRAYMKFYRHLPPLARKVLPSAWSLNSESELVILNRRCIPSPELRTTLLECLKDRDHTRKMLALDALLHTASLHGSPPLSVAELVTLFNDPDTEVRERAKRTLEKSAPAALTGSDK